MELYQSIGRENGGQSILAWQVELDHVFNIIVATQQGSCLGELGSRKPEGVVNIVFMMIRKYNPNSKSVLAS